MSGHGGKHDEILPLLHRKLVAYKKKIKKQSESGEATTQIKILFQRKKKLIVVQDERAPKRAMASLTPVRSIDRRISEMQRLRSVVDELQDDVS